MQLQRYLTNIISTVPPFCFLARLSYTKMKRCQDVSNYLQWSEYWLFLFIPLKKLILCVISTWALEKMKCVRNSHAGSGNVEALWSVLFSERPLGELCPRANSSLNQFSLPWSGCDILSLENGRVS